MFGQAPHNNDTKDFFKTHTVSNSSNLQPIQFYISIPTFVQTNIHDISGIITNNPIHKPNPPTMKPTTTPLTTLLFTLPLLTAASNDNCIKLTGSSSYTWKADGSFASLGSGPIANKTHCFGSGSGGISIGAPDALPGAAGNTRIECFFPESETDADFYNCNLSLVDGFSAAVTCEVAGGGWPNSHNESQPLGCGYDLMADCPEEAYDDDCKCCKNHAGAHVESAKAVAPVFQACDHSDEFANSAEIYYNMIGAFKFKKSDFPLECKVGPGEVPPSSAGKMVRRESHAHQHSHATAGRQQKRSATHPHQLRARDFLEVVT